MNICPFLSLSYNDIFLTICQYVIIFAVHLIFQNSNNSYCSGYAYEIYFDNLFTAIKDMGNLNVQRCAVL